MDIDAALSRRTLLQRGSLLLLGALGLSKVAADTRSVSSVAKAADPVATLTLIGSGWRYWPSGGQPGARPAHGDRAIVTGNVLSAAGSALGDFHGMTFLVDGNHTGTTGGNLELHTFNLEGGTLTGMGMAGTGDGSFTVVGGTGKYAGARGTYTGRSSPLGTGGDGSAKFTFHLF